MSEARTWTMWATDEGDYFANAHNDIRYAQAFLSGDNSVAQVSLRENPEGRYYGWMDNSEDFPTMVASHPGMFSIQFTYGPEAEVEVGRGRIVRLDVERVDA